MKSKATMLVISAIAFMGSAAQGQFYSTSFEPPLFNVGGSVNGIDGWANGSGTGQGFIISDDRASIGSQSLKSDNSNLTSFYSVRHDLGSWTAASGDLLEVSVDLWIDPSTGVNRIYGIVLGSSATSTLGGTVLGLTIGGDGSVRGGTAWSNTYQNTGLLGQAAAGSYEGRWLTVSLTYDPNTTIKTASISGFADGSSFAIVPSSAGVAPNNLNLGVDYFGSTNIDRNGIAYFDNIVVGDASTTPECLGDIADDFGFTVNEGGGPDGMVDFGDFVALLGLIGPCSGGTPGCLGDIADDFGFTVNEGGGPDGMVDFGDFVALLGLIGPCP